MSGSLIRRFALLGGVALVAAGSAVALPASATPMLTGYGDVTSAVVYGPNGPIGSVVQDLVDEDDEYSTVAAPFPINFFGTKYDGLCITTNGTVSPVLTSSDSCSDNYDENLENLALDSQAPVIAALALDVDPSEDLWHSGPSIDSIGRTGGLTTVTTSAPHGFSVGDDAYIWGGDDPDYSYDNDYTVVSVPSATSFTFSDGSADVATHSVVGGTVSTGDYDDSTDDSDADGLADDGFGDVKSIYFGTTTINGQDAAVITYYRIPNNDDENSPALYNTFQIVLIKDATTNGSAVGYDFTIQYNYGTLTDGDDGYDVTQPGGSCNSLEPECRWGVGWADYIPGTPDTADPYELFGDTTVADLLDGGATPIVANSLNSSVLGRYTFKMVGGVTQGFSTPTLAAPTAGTPAPTPTADPLAPVQPASEMVGATAGTEGGIAVPVTVTPTTDRKGVLMTGSGFTMTFVGATSSGAPVDLDSDGNLVLSTTGTVQVSGSGFLPNSQVKVYLFSTPTQLGTTTTDSAGSFSASFVLPSGVAAGVHTVQASGYTTGNVVRTLNLGVSVKGPALASTGFDPMPLAAGGGIILLLGAALLMASKRRRSGASAE